MDGGRGSGCGCCSCGCLGCLMPLIAIVIVMMVIFGLFVPMNRNYQHMIPDTWDEYYPDINDGTNLPTDKGALLPAYELSEALMVSYAAF